MALNMAVPLPGIGGISSMSPIRMECWDNLKMMVSPIGSESSGVSSLDSEDIKITPTAQKRPEAVKRELRIYYNGRNVLDLYNNLETNSSTWNFRYSHLPEKNNISMFWANRSLYNRLGPNGLTPVYTISKCECCDFQFTSDCPNSYLSETSLVLSSTTSSPMMFTTASSTKRAEFRPPKAALSVTPTLNLSSGFKHHHQQQQQQLREHKNCPEPTINKQFINQNKPKISDMFSTKNNGLFGANNNNNNGYFNNINKFNNGICSTKTMATTDLSQLASNLVSMNFSNSTSYTPPLINYGNNVVHNNDYNETMLSKNSKSNVPMPTTNLFNNSSINLANLNTPVASANYSFQDNNIFPNNIHPNQIHSGNSVGNKSQSSSSNNLFSLFNSNNNNNNNNTNNSVNNAFSANVESNTFINSFNNPINNNNRNNIGNNPLTVNSQNYGRMYKYF
ncbi:homeobox protein 2-like [Eupeodes corollae]|uniref:homeobox protein 2-like n=1 Tax=Eupeodes corollae TaxID=290404 RepID=UPI0024905F28|nr:homeobox protein 2-like [Eupeodes corollae]XP_055901926.1 homeobox protein 2-like [Eupeodes corollae]